MERAKKMAFISANRRLLRKRKAPQGKEEDAMDLLLEISLDDPEPYVQEWLRNIIKLNIIIVVFLFRRRRWRRLPLWVFFVEYSKSIAQALQ